MTLTEFLATWGAILSTVGITWNVIRDRRDRAILKLEGMLGIMYPDDTDSTYLVLTVTNVGRRPVLLTGLRGMLDKPPGSKPGLYIKAERLPQMLKEGEYFAQPIPDLEILSDKLKSLYAVDSANRKWYMSPQNIKRLVKERADMLKSENDKPQA